MKIYKKTISWIPLIYIIIVIALITSIKILLPSNYFDASILLYVFIGLQLLIILFIIWVRYNSQLIIKEKSIQFKGLFKNREVYFNDIIGFKKEYYERSRYESIRYIALETTNETDKVIKVRNAYVNFIELQEWIETSFTDLDLIEEKAEWNNVLENEKYGSNAISRSLFIKQSKKVANILNNTTILLFILVFFPATHTYILIPALVLTTLALCAVFYFKGLIRLENFTKYKVKIINKKNKKPQVKTYETSVFTDVFLAISLPVGIVFYIVFSDYTILSYNDLWKDSLLISTLLFLFSLLTTKEFVYHKLNSYLNLAIVYLMLFGYAFFGIIAINCTFDESTPIEHTGSVVYKSSDLISGKSIFKKYDYILTVKSPELAKLSKIKVTKEVYEGLENGSNYTFTIREGLFNMQWVLVKENNNHEY